MDNNNNNNHNRNDEVNHTVYISFNKNDSSVSSFISYLIAAFNRQGIISAFVDGKSSHDEAVEREMGPEEFSKLRVVVVGFSKNYALHVSFLEKQILEYSYRNNNDFVVVLVFYGVSVSSVKQHTERFGEEFDAVQRSMIKWRPGHEYDCKRRGFKHSVENIDLRGESSINAEWMAYIGGFVNLISLNLSDCQRLNSSTLWPITGLTSLKELDLSRCWKVTDAGIKHLQSVVYLEKLWISQTGVTKVGISLLASLKKLSLLDLGGLPVTDQNLIALQALTKLEYLDIWGSNTPNIPHLECLHMNMCTIVTEPKTQSSLASLKKLVLSGANFSAETEALSFTNKSSITYLDVSKTSLQNFSFLETMINLEHLDLSSTAFGDDSVGFVACVGENLRNLNVSDTKITSAGVGNLAGHVPQLETFSLSQTFVDDLSILLISTMMPCIKALDLGMTSIRGFILQQSPQEEQAEPSLAALQSLTSLKTLSLEHPYLGDTALSALSSLTGLTHLQPWGRIDMRPES
ncbi:unnamed protein product [Arabidopsis arenosa]|uniref:TIR domain-containing protein n=1 Tax=Arabidopsis arenosa TaxID=38785 RepID=A0A8S2B1L6_ARAAE|nr:unnamed protein product [Arabidopsis arenosa]CAE6218686.1 unnamed protein product [Arabidopsis arenosa]